MGDRKITLFEVHLHETGGLQFGPTIGSKREDYETEGEADEIETDAEEEEDSGGNGVRVLIGLVMLVAMAVVAKKLMDRRSDDDEEDLEFGEPESADLEITEHEP